MQQYVKPKYKTFCKCGINKRGLDTLAKKVMQFIHFIELGVSALKMGTVHYNNCGNSNGSRPIPTRIKKRVNRRHELQIDIPNSKQFASDRNETICKGGWTDYQSIVLNEICRISHMECYQMI